MKDLEAKTGKQFGGADNPLLVSVRSGSSMSMPGMMDTILNLGLNKNTLQGLIKLTDNPRFGYDAYRRFIQLYGKIALGVEDKHFDDAMAAMKRKVGARRTSTWVRSTSRNWPTSLRRSSRPTPASPSRKIPTSSSNWRSRPYSAPGTASARSTIANSSGSPRPRPTARR
jgi:hypothetical protein